MSTSAMSTEKQLIAQNLAATGIPQVQAGAIAAEIIGNAERQHRLLTDTLCSKVELNAVESRLTAKIDSVETRLTEQIQGVEARTTAQINGVETRLTEQIHGVEARSTAQINEMETRLTEQIRAVEIRSAKEIHAVETRLTAEVSALGAKTVTKVELSDAITKSKNEIILWVVGSIFLAQLLPNLLQRFG